MVKKNQNNIFAMAADVEEANAEAASELAHDFNEADFDSSYEVSQKSDTEDLAEKLDGDLDSNLVGHEGRPDARVEADTDSNVDADLKARLHHLEQVAQAYEQQNAMLAQHSDLLRQQLEESGEQLANENDLKFEYEKSALKTQLQVLKGDKKAAFETGNSDLFEAAEEAISDIQQRLHEVESLQRQRADIAMPPPQPYFAPPPQPTYTPEFQGWLSQNSWYNPNSPDFDRDLASLADHFDNNMKKYCKLNGLTHFVGSKDYLDTISQSVREAVLGGRDDSAPTFKNTGGRVEAVSRTQYGSPRKGTGASKDLIKDQLDILDRIVEYNADGSPMSVQQKIKMIKG